MARLTRELPFAVPNLWNLARPFAIMSAVLSFLVPMNRCDGLQHGLLSQWWQIIRPSGIGPYASANATRCALVLSNAP